MNDVIILDDVLPDVIFNTLIDLCVNNPHYGFGVTETSIEDDPHKSFATSPTDFWERNFLSLPLLMATSKINYNLKEIIRIRLGLLHRDINQIINSPHIDHPVSPHLVGLYYLNDTDGSTKIWSQQHTNWGKEADILSINNCDLLTEIEPKKNRMAIFNGAHYHSSMLPSITQLRYTVNYNFI